MPRVRMTALTARGDRDRTNAFAEFHDCNETVTGVSVPAFGVWSRSCVKRCERSPRAGHKWYGDARLAVIEMGCDAVVQTLEAVDFSPWRLPRAEIRR